MEVASRIRFGDDPVAVLGDLTARLPLETVQQRRLKACMRMPPKFGSDAALISVRACL